MKLITPPKLMLPFRARPPGYVPNRADEAQHRDHRADQRSQNSLRVGLLVRKSACHQLLGTRPRVRRDQEAQAQVEIERVQVHVEGMRDGGECSRRKEPRKKGPSVMDTSISPWASSSSTKTRARPGARLRQPSAGAGSL